VNHAFYYDAGGEPGGVIPGCDFPGNTDFTSDGHGDLSTILGNGSCVLDVIERIWVSQNVRQDFNPFGQHVWASRTGAVGNPAVWKNPGDGFAVGCVDWEPANAVCGATGEDLLFEVLGQDIHDCFGFPGGDPVSAIGPSGVVLMILSLGGGSAYILRRRG
jgi:hypothetical protein